MEYRIRQVKVGGRRWRDAGKFYLVSKGPGTAWGESGPPCDTREACYLAWVKREPNAAAAWRDRLLPPA